MKETQILRGLTKAKNAGMPAYADGMVPHRPTVNERFIGKLTGGAFGYKEPAKPAAVAAPVVRAAPVEQPTGLRKVANTLSNRQSQIDNALKDAGAYADGMVPFLDENSVINGPGTGTSDSVTARVSNDEAILPAKTVEAVGPTNIARLIEATNGKTPKRGLGVAEYADGFVASTLEKTKKGLSAASDFLKGGSPAPNTPAATAAAESGPKLVSKAPLQTVTAVGQDAASASGKLAGGASAAEGTGAAAKTTLRGLAGKALLPLAVAGSSVKSLNTPTKEFQQRTGIDNEWGARTAGVLEDIGNTVTFGQANKLGNFMGGAGWKSSEELAGTAAAPSTVAATTPVQPPANTAAPTDQGTIAPNVFTPTTQSEAKSLRDAARNGGTEYPEPGTGFVVSDTEGANPRATRIDSRGGLNRASRTSAAATDPFAQSRDLLAQAAAADNSGTLSGQIRSSNLRRQATQLTEIADKESGHLDRQAANAVAAGTNTLKANLDMATNARAEVAADQQRADAFQKRLERFFPDTGTGDDKIDNSAKRAELQTMLEATMSKLPAEEQAKLVNPYTGQARGVEALDPKLAERLLFNAKVRDRVQEAGSGLGNLLTGNQAGDLSDNLLDYDLGSATKRGDFYVFPNGAKISENDFRYLEGQANTFLPNAIQDMYNTPTSNFSSRARNGR